MNKQQIGYDEELDHNLRRDRVKLCIFTTLKSTQSTLYFHSQDRIHKRFFKDKPIVHIS